MARRIRTANGVLGWKSCEKLHERCRDLIKAAYPAYRNPQTYMHVFEHKPKKTAYAVVLCCLATKVPAPADVDKPTIRALWVIGILQYGAKALCYRREWTMWTDDKYNVSGFGEHEAHQKYGGFMAAGVDLMKRDMYYKELQQADLYDETPTLGGGGKPMPRPAPQRPRRLLSVGPSPMGGSS